MYSGSALCTEFYKLLTNKLNGSSFGSAPINYMYMYTYTNPYDRNIASETFCLVWESLFSLFLFFSQSHKYFDSINFDIVAQETKNIYACVCFMFKICKENRHQNQNPKQTEKSLPVLYQKCSHNIFGWKTLSWLVFKKIVEVKKKKRRLNIRSTR